MRLLRLALASGLVLPAACGGNDGTDGAAFPPATVEASGTIEPPSGPRTALASPPDVPIVPLRKAPAPLFRLERLYSNLGEPVYVAQPESDSENLYIVERAGRILSFRAGDADPTIVLDIRKLVRTEIEEGLHSIAFHPDYGENGRFFVVYNDRKGDVRIVEYHSEGGRADPDSAREIFAIDKTEGVKWHNGGQLAFGPDGALYFAMGDSARNQYDELPDPPSTPDPENNAQNLRLPFGKLFRFDVDEQKPKPEVVALGLRNVWRFSFDRRNGDLYLADVGQFGWEELDVLLSGTSGLVNYGWSLYEATAVHNKGFELARGRLAWPVLRYRHGPGLYCSIRGSITGGYVYRGTAIPDLAGRYIFGDYCSGEIWTARVVEGRATDMRKEPVDVPQLVSFGEDAEGELYAVSQMGEVFRLVPAG